MQTHLVLEKKERKKYLLLPTHFTHLHSSWEQWNFVCVDRYMNVIFSELLLLFIVFQFFNFVIFHENYSPSHWWQKQSIGLFYLLSVNFSITETQIGFFDGNFLQKSVFPLKEEEGRKQQWCFNKSKFFFFFFHYTYSTLYRHKVIIRPWSRSQRTNLPLA